MVPQTGGVHLGMYVCMYELQDPRKLASFRSQLRPQTVGVHGPRPNTYQYVSIRALRKHCDLLGTEQSEDLQNAPGSSQQVCPPPISSQVERVTLLYYPHAPHAIQDENIISN